MCSRSLDTTDRLEIGLYDHGSAGSKSVFLSRGVISAALKTNGTVAFESERLKSSVRNGAIRSATSFSFSSACIVTDCVVCIAGIAAGACV